MLRSISVTICFDSCAEVNSELDIMQFNEFSLWSVWRDMYNAVRQSIEQIGSSAFFTVF